MKSFLLVCFACFGFCFQIFAQIDKAKSEVGKATLNQSPIRYDTPLEYKIPAGRDNYTITESAELDKLLSADTSGENDFNILNRDLREAIENYEHAQDRPKADTARTHLRNVLIGFILELVISLIVLQIAFSLIGFPSLFYQIALLSLVLALSGALLEFFLYLGLLNPIRIGISFIVLLLLIRQMTDVREWSTAIQVALIARTISIGLMWLGLAGSMALLGL
jgi:hypothetical protein